MQEVVGTYASRDEAQEILDLLVEHKFPAERLGIQLSSEARPLVERSGRPSRHREALLGAVIGALIGGTLGFVLSLAYLTVPGMIIGALVGALFGSAVDVAEAVLEPEAADAPTAGAGYQLVADREIAQSVRDILADCASRG